MRIHLIAIGGAIMHQLAIALKLKGHEVSGSDDQISEPSRSNLERHGLLPDQIGFDSSRITRDIDAIVLGMHAKYDNPELARAVELGLKVYSFPEYVYIQSQNKLRIVIAGSHGKTTITSMIMHVMREQNMAFDYLVGSSVAGFEYSVKITDAPIIILEGDEYLASALNKEPKFIYYQANIATISGIEWDHINVFETEEKYYEQFRKLVRSLAPDATLYYHNEPKILKTIEHIRPDVELIPYQAAQYQTTNGAFELNVAGETYRFDFFGAHNMANMEAAHSVCRQIGISDSDFYTAMQTFGGAGRRLEKLVDTPNQIVYKDFAHSPSKLRATVKAVMERHPDRKIIACYEMHTFSSMSADFLPQYRDTFGQVTYPIVYMDREVVLRKGNQPFDKEAIIAHFGRHDISYFTDIDTLQDFLKFLHTEPMVFLMMSSGTFSGIDLSQIGNKTLTATTTSEVTTQYQSTSAITSSHTDTGKSTHTAFDPFGSLYQTAHLSFEQSKRLLIIYLISTLVPCIGPYAMYQTIYPIRQLHNLVCQLVNFQLLIVLVILGLAIVTTSIFPILNLPLLCLVMLTNVMYVYRAHRHLTLGEPVQMPAGITAMKTLSQL